MNDLSTPRTAVIQPRSFCKAMINIGLFKKQELKSIEE